MIEQIGKAFTEEEQIFITKHLKEIPLFLLSEQGKEVLKLALSEFKNHLANIGVST